MNMRQIRMLAFRWTAGLADGRTARQVIMHHKQTDAGRQVTDTHTYRRRRDTRLGQPPAEDVTTQENNARSCAADSLISARLE